MTSTNSITRSEGKKARLKGLVALMRPRQWVKNVFVLAPLVFSGAFHNPENVGRALLAFMLFCAASSATYVVNDIRDIEYDRRHPRKSRSRPLASGALQVRQALALLGVLYAILIWGSFQLPGAVLVIAGYVALNIAYSFGLKHQPVIDIFAIAIGFVLRVYAGAVALSVPLSAWMFVTTLSLALYLASVKRGEELAHSGTDGRQVLAHYNQSLVERYAQMSATGALVFYSLYVVSANPALVITIPFVLYGLFRYWFVVEVKGGGESPTDALLTDPQLMLTVLAWGVICLWLLWPTGR